ncbi:hypothetical protein D3C78_1502270 [compost metagenome]
MEPDSAITGPTERSMPPVRIAQVMPTAIMALIDTWRATLVRLLTVRKLSLSPLISRNRMAKPIKGSIAGWCSNFSQRLPRLCFWAAWVGGDCSIPIIMHSRLHEA